MDPVNLHVLIKANNFAKLNEVLNHKEVDINRSDEDGWTALHLSVRYGYFEIFEVLISYGANVNCVNKVGITPLYLAANKNYTKMVELLLKRGANVNQDDANGKSPMNQAIRQGHIETVKILLANGVNINRTDEDGDTALHYAVLSNNTKIVRLLLTDKYINLNQPNDDGETPLMLTARITNGFQIAKILLKAGADPSSNKNGTILHLASIKDKLEIIDLIIRKGGVNFINFVDALNYTALHYAAYNGYFEIVRYLLKHGADPLIKTSEGMIALDLANGQEIIELLKQAE